MRLKCAYRFQLLKWIDSPQQWPAHVALWIYKTFKVIIHLTAQRIVFPQTHFVVKPACFSHWCQDILDNHVHQGSSYGWCFFSWSSEGNLEKETWDALCSLRNICGWFHTAERKMMQVLLSIKDCWGMCQIHIPVFSFQMQYWHLEYGKSRGCKRAGRERILTKPFWLIFLQPKNFLNFLKYNWMDDTLSLYKVIQWFFKVSLRVIFVI